jgi:hypothetical protein
MELLLLFTYLRFYDFRVLVFLVRAHGILTPTGGLNEEDYVKISDIPSQNWKSSRCCTVRTM